MNTSDILNKAADLIEERGWVRGGGGWPTPDRTDQSLCLEGGVIAALGADFHDVDLLNFWTCPAYVAVCNYLGLGTEMEDDRRGGLRPAEPLWRWNDQKALSIDQVIEVLRATAVIEAARETQPAEVPA